MNENIEMLMKFLWAILLLDVSRTNSVFTNKLVPSCNFSQWQCDNGDCINSEDRCDGVYNCADRSDEIVDHCIHLPCPVYAFRCAYGACIAGNNKCNDQQDCVDNSDETDLQCSTELTELEQVLQGNCGPFQFQCKSGQCIKSEDKCDGVYDCDDHSDETVILCSSLFCPSYAFRCGYGGCIRGSAKCDGICDCADGSDEALDLCGYTREYKRNFICPASTISPVKHKDQNNGCLIPFSLEAMQVQNVSNRKYLELGTRVSPGTFVQFICDKHHMLEGVPQNECRNKNWKHKLPVCTKYCPQHTIHKGISTTVSCVYNNYPIDCNSFLRKKTLANVRCASGYKLPPDVNRKQLKLRCNANHEWNYPKVKCVPKCGMLGNDDGTSMPLSQTPWHVSIFKREINAMQRICGGTIISPKLVITAAKCFSTFEPIYYAVVLGHQPQRLHEKDLTNKEVYNLSDIFSPHNDLDESRNGPAFATLINHMDFGKPNVMPICLSKEMSMGNVTWPSSVEHYNRTLSTSQKAKLGELDIGFALSAGSSTHKIIRGIIIEKFETDDRELRLINVSFYENFIKKAIQKYRYLL